MENVIEIKGLYKSYGEVKAVQNLSFKVKKGELFAFLGLNGAGKSTTISIMCGQLKKDGGMVEIMGKNLDENLSEIKRELGVVFQNSVLDKPLSVYQNLKTRAALYDIRGEEFEKVDIALHTDGKIRYTVPQHITQKKDVAVFFRVADVYRDAKIVVRDGDKIVISKKKQKLAPAEMEKVELSAELISSLSGEGLSFSIEF